MGSHGATGKQVRPVLIVLVSIFMFFLRFIWNCGLGKEKPDISTRRVLSLELPLVFPVTKENEVV